MSEKLVKCDCGNEFLLTEQMKPGKRTFACRVRCKECGRFSWGVGADPDTARVTAKERWNRKETVKI